MSRRCRRCDHVADIGNRDDDLAAAQAHAQSAQHWLCRVCGTSLRWEESATCGPCVAAVRDALTEIVTLYAQLEVPIRSLPKAQPYDTAHARSSDTSLLTPLVMRSPGNAGTSAPSASGDRSHAADNHPDDPPAVVAELAGCEDDWRVLRGRFTSTHANPGPPTLVGAVGYLTRHLAWAADAHPAFDEFAALVADLRRRLQAAVGDGEARTSGAPCQHCHVPLVKSWDDSGASDDWHCPRCRRVYTEAEYWLAVRAEYEALRDAQCG